MPSSLGGIVGSYCQKSFVKLFSGYLAAPYVLKMLAPATRFIPRYRTSFFRSVSSLTTNPSIVGACRPTQFLQVAN